MRFETFLRPSLDLRSNSYHPPPPKESIRNDTEILRKFHHSRLVGEKESEHSRGSDLGAQSETWRRSMSLRCWQLPSPMVIPVVGHPDRFCWIRGIPRGSSATPASGQIVDRVDR